MKQLTQHGFEISLGHGPVKRRMKRALRPVDLALPIDLDLLEVMEELDPGMVDWLHGQAIRVA